MNIVPLIQLPLQIRNPDHNEQILPHVGGAQLERFADGGGGAQLRTGDLAILG